MTAGPRAVLCGMSGGGEAGGRGVRAGAKPSLIWRADAAPSLTHPGDRAREPAGAGTSATLAERAARGQGAERGASPLDAAHRAHRWSALLARRSLGSPAHRSVKSAAFPSFAAGSITFIRLQAESGQRSYSLSVSRSPFHFPLPLSPLSLHLSLPQVEMLPSFLLLS